jgi:hypothetical protein
VLRVRRKHRPWALPLGSDYTTHISFKVL